MKYIILPTSKICFLILYFVHLLFIPFFTCAQVGIIDDAVRVGINASKLARVKNGSKFVKYLDNIDDLRIPISVASRKALNLPLAEAAATVFATIDLKTGYQLAYIGIENGAVKVVRPVLHATSVDIELPLQAIDDFIREITIANEIERTKYILEPDVLSSPTAQKLIDEHISHVYVANYDGLPWPIKKQPDGKYIAKIKPSVFTELDEGVLKNFIDLYNSSFDSEDLKILSLFDKEADLESITAIEKVSISTPAKNFMNINQVISNIKEAKGKVITIIGHVEAENFVIRNSVGKVVSKLNIRDIELAAQQAECALILLGCETAEFSGLSGLLTKVNSLDIASNLTRAVKARTYGDFLEALGTTSEPFLVRNTLVDKVTYIVASRVDNRLLVSNGINRIRISSKLISGQQVAAARTFRTMPIWFNKIYDFYFSIGIIAVILAIFFTSRKPLIWFLWGLIAPLMLIAVIYYTIIEPKENPDRLDTKEI